MLIAIPDRRAERNLFAIAVPKLGSFIASGTWDSKEVGLDTFPPEDRPPVVIPFFTFRLMVGMGLIMLAVSWFGVWLRWRGRLETTRWFLWVAFLSFPTGFVAVLAGWFTAEVGRQPWVVYGLLRTKDAVTPSLATGDVVFSLLAYVVVYAVIYCVRLLLHLSPVARRAGGCGEGPGIHAGPRARRGHAGGAGVGRNDRMEPSALALFWAGVIAVAIVVYVILDGFDLGVGILFGTTRDPALRAEMMDFDLAVLGRQRDLAGDHRRLAVRGVSGRLRGVPAGVLHPGAAAAVRADLSRRRLRVPLPRQRARIVGLGLLPRLRRRRLRAGRGGRRDDPRHPRGERPVRRRPFEWLAPLPVLCGIGLVLGYALLGAGWLVLKTEGALRDWAWRRIPWLAVAVLVVLALAVVASFAERDRDRRP